MAAIGEDRLSLLPHEILIGILSRLPLRFAISTGCLSKRWRGHWAKVTSIDIINRESETLSEFSTAFCNILTQITSPSIHCFTLKFEELSRGWNFQPPDYSWLRDICDRNVRELKVTWPYFLDRFMLSLPSFIFQTPSLISIELDRTFEWKLPNDGDPINLPNLKSLSLTFGQTQCKCLDKLIKACPSLEELSLQCQFYGMVGHLNFSNQNLRRLFMNLGSGRELEVVINAPKLEYLAITAPRSFTFYFEEEPLLLREAKIKVNGSLYPYLLELNGAISNIRFLTLDVFALHRISIVFCYVTHVTLDMKMSHDIRNVSSVMELCPVLDGLTLKLCDVGRDDNEQQSMLPKSAHVSTFLRGLKRIEIKTSWFNYGKPAKSFLELIEYLLCNAIDLKHFQFRLNGDKKYENWNAERKQRCELNFCKLLYNCPMVSVGCEVEFEGLFLNMSRKAGPRVCSVDGQVIPLHSSPWNGFIFEEE